MRIAVVAAASLSSLFTLGCGAEFLPASVVVNERVIAVTASPPEAVPGEEVTLTPTVVAPGGELAAGEAYEATWWRCPETDSDALGDFAQCTVPSERRDIATGVPYVDTVPPDLFGDLSPEGELRSDKLLGAILGYWRVVGLTMESGERRVDAFKRIPVYLPVRLGEIDPRLAELDSHVDENGVETGPNTNPTISGIAIHEDKREGGTVASITAGKTYFIEPLFDAASLQHYISLKVDLEGLDLSQPETLQDEPVEELLTRFQKVQRCEIPTFSWFVTHGRVRRDTTLDERVVASHFDPQQIDCPDVEGEERFPEAEYTPPEGTEEDPLPDDGIVRGWVVMRDGRGGTAVRSFEMALD